MPSVADTQPLTADEMRGVQPQLAAGRTEWLRLHRPCGRASFAKHNHHRAKSIRAAERVFLRQNLLPDPGGSKPRFLCGRACPDGDKEKQRGIADWRIWKACGLPRAKKIFAGRRKFTPIQREARDFWLRKLWKSWPHPISGQSARLRPCRRRPEHIAQPPQQPSSPSDSC